MSAGRIRRSSCQHRIGKGCGLAVRAEVIASLERHAICCELVGSCTMSTSTFYHGVLPGGPCPSNPVPASLGTLCDARACF